MLWHLWQWYAVVLLWVLTERGQVVFLSHLKQIFEISHVLAFRRVSGKQMEIRNKWSFKESVMGTVLWQRNSTAEPGGTGQGWHVLLVSAWLATGQIKGSFTEDMVLSWCWWMKWFHPERDGMAFSVEEPAGTISDRCETPGVTRKDLQDLNGQRVCGGERGGSETEKVDMPVESHCWFNIILIHFLYTYLFFEFLKQE